MPHTYKAISLNLIGEVTRFDHQSTVIHQMIRKNNIYQLRFNVLVEISTYVETPSRCIDPHLQNPTYYILATSPFNLLFLTYVRLQLVFKFSLQSKWWLIYYIIDIHEGMHMVSSLLTYLWSVWTFILPYVYPVQAVPMNSIKEGNQYLQIWVRNFFFFFYFKKRGGRPWSRHSLRFRE